jgi:signal transduction histidine kinase
LPQWHPGLEGKAGDHPGESPRRNADDGTGDTVQRRSNPGILFPPAVAATGRDGEFESLEVNHQHWRTLTKAHMLGNRAVVLRAARTEDQLRGQLGEILLVLVVGAPFLVALAGAGGYAMARRALAPMDHLASAAQRISAERLRERIEVTNPTDEIGRLASIMNAAFARLESSFERLRRFTADASHELRTPLAVICGIGEAAVAGPRDAPRYAEAIGGMLEETDRMTHLVDTLLRLSHGDARTIRINREPIDLGQLTHDVASSLGVLAEERQQTLLVDACAGTIVPADRLVLREAITNVVDNAIKYRPAGSTIAPGVCRDVHNAAVTVSDQGPGIPAEHRQRIFDRFFRIDEGRARAWWRWTWSRHRQMGDRRSRRTHRRGRCAGRRRGVPSRAAARA